MGCSLGKGAMEAVHSVNLEIGLTTSIAGKYGVYANSCRQMSPRNFAPEKTLILLTPRYQSTAWTIKTVFADYRTAKVAKTSICFIPWMKYHSNNHGHWCLQRPFANPAATSTSTPKHNAHISPGKAQEGCQRHRLFGLILKNLGKWRWCQKKLSRLFLATR